jgi:hypothetical protein
MQEGALSFQCWKCPAKFQYIPDLDHLVAIVGLHEEWHRTWPRP